MTLHLPTRYNVHNLAARPVLLFLKTADEQSLSKLI